MKCFLDGTKIAVTRVEIEMDKDKLQSLLLLDLCAFAASLPNDPSQYEAIRDFELAYSLAEKHELSDRYSYRDFMNRI